MQSRWIIGALPLLVVFQAWISIVVAQIGMGMGLGMGMAGPMAEMNIAEMGQFSMLGRAAREIVHPNAQPTPAMIHIAMRQGGLPRNLPMMMDYLPHMVNLAYQHGVQPTGTFGRPGLQSMQEYIQQRVVQWMTGASLPRPVTAVQPPSSGNAATSPYQSVSLVVSAPAANDARVPVARTANVVSQPQVVPKTAAQVAQTSKVVSQPQMVPQKIPVTQTAKVDTQPQVVSQGIPVKVYTQPQVVKQKIQVAQSARVVSPQKAPAPQRVNIPPHAMALSDYFAYQPAASPLENYLMMGMIGHADMMPGFGF